MNATDQVALQAQLAALKAKYPTLQSEGKGLFRKFVGWADIEPLEFPPDFQWEALTDDDISELPVICEDPLSALAATCLFHSDRQNRRATPPRSPEQLREMRFQPVGYLSLRRDCIKENAALLRLSGRPPGDSVIQKRSRCYRLVCWAEKWSGPNRIKTAQEDITSRKKIELIIQGKEAEEKEPDLFPKNWRTTIIDKRLSIELQVITDKMERVQKTFRTCSVRNTRCETGDFGGRKKKNKARRRQEAAQLISAYSAPGELCRHQVEEITDGAVHNSEDPAYLVLALAIATLSEPSSLLLVDFTEPCELDGVFVSRRAVRRLHQGPKYEDERELYEPANSEIPIFWPPALTHKFLKRRSQGELPVRIQDVYHALRGLCPIATWDKLVRTLVRHGDAWFGMPWLWAMPAAYPDRKKPAPSHYSRLSAIQYRRLLPFLRRFDPSMTLPVESLAGLSYGSKWVLRLERIQEFARTWRRLLNQPLPNDFWDALIGWNVLAAGAYDMSRLFCGLRAGSIPPPTCMQNGMGHPVTILRQKRVVLAYYPEKFREFWPLLLQRLEEVRTQAAAAGVDVEWFNYADFIYCHYRVGHREDGKRPLQPVIPSHHNSAEAYAYHPAFSQYSTWWPAWPRHFTNTYLRDLGYPELSVQRFHAHAPSSLEPLHWDQASPSIDFDLHEKISKDLSALLFHS